MSNSGQLKARHILRLMVYSIAQSKPCPGWQATDGNLLRRSSPRIELNKGSCRTSRHVAGAHTFFCDQYATFDNWKGGGPRSFMVRLSTCFPALSRKESEIKKDPLTL